MRCVPAGFDRHLLLTIALFSLVICTIYSVAVLYDYAWTDDFSTLLIVHSKGSDEILPFYNAQGRPLGGLIIWVAFYTAWTMKGLRWIRLACLAMALTSGTLLAIEFRRVVPAWIGLGAVLLLLLNPAVAVFIAWPSSGSLSLPATLLALVAGGWWLRALERTAPRVAGFWWRITGACGLTIASLLIYQPCACFFLLPAAVGLLNANDARRALRNGTWTAAGFAALCVTYFVAFQSLRPKSLDDRLTHRADFVTDIPDRVQFFVSHIVARSFESWTVFFGSPTTWIVIVAAVVLTLPFVVRLARTPGGIAVRLQAWLLMPVFYGLASGPLLVVKDNYAPFRTLGGLYGLVAVGFAGGVATLWRWLPPTQRAARMSVAVCWAGWIVANGVLARYVTNEGLVLRSVREINRYRNFVRRELPEHPSEVIFLLPYPHEVPHFSRIKSNEEFGLASSTVDWTFPGLPYCVFDEEYGNATSVDVVTGWRVVLHDLPADGPGLFAANLPVFNAAQALKAGASPVVVSRSGSITQDPFFGEVQQITPTLRLSRWFGLYEVLLPTEIAHRELGVLKLAGPGGTDCWFHREGWGWFWCNPKSFPWVYHNEDQHWLLYLRGSRRPARFYDKDAPGRPFITVE